jgi:hypothetical protein
MVDADAIRQRWEAVGAKLDERGRRLFAAAAALNGRNVPSPRGGRWYAAQVIRMRTRPATGPRRKTRKGLLELQNGPPEMDI